jgi:hypothetical protein
MESTVSVRKHNGDEQNQSQYFVEWLVSLDMKMGLLK